MKQRSDWTSPEFAKELRLYLCHPRGCVNGLIRQGIWVDEKKLSALRNKKHRSSIVRNFPLYLLVRRLHALVIKTRGKLTLWNDPESLDPKGSLPAALNILRPHLSEAIPKKLNFRTLHRYLTMPEG